MNMTKKARTILFLCFAMLTACTLPGREAKAEAIGKYTLSVTNKNSNYDVTGDGVSDTVEFKKLKSSGSENSEYQAFKVIINGNTALCRNEKSLSYYDIEPVFIQTKGHSYFLISLFQQDYGRETKIYEYVNGSLKKRLDLDKTFGKIYFSFYTNISSVKTNSFTCKFKGETAMLGLATTMSFTYKTKSSGALSLSKKTVNVTYSNKRMKMTAPYNFYKSKYLVAEKKIQVYRSATGTQKAFRIKKGTKLKIKKISIQGKTPRYYCVTKSGKKGWIKSTQSGYGLFRGVLYAQ